MQPNMHERELSEDRMSLVDSGLPDKVRRPVAMKRDPRMYDFLIVSRINSLSK